MSSPATSQVLTLRCPYPGCGGVVGELSLDGELAACPKCGRVSARCPARQTRSGRCPALNRPLAGFCRLCGRSRLVSGWAEELWAHDLAFLGPQSHSPRALEVGTSTVVLELDTWLTEPRRALSLGLQIVAGYVWLGGCDGRSLFVPPFYDLATDKALGPSRHLWEGAPSLHPRAKADGPWLVVWSERGLQVECLLGFDEAETEPTPIDVALKAPANRLASAPLLSALGEGDGLVRYTRRLAWLEQRGSGEAVLRSMVLSLNAGASKPTAAVLQSSGKSILEAGEYAVLLEASFGSRRQLLICTRREVWLTDLPGAAATLPATPLLRGLPDLQQPRLRLNQGDIPGAVFVARRSDDQNETPPGDLYFSYETTKGSTLACLTFAPDRPSSLITFPRPALPLTESGNRDVLCLAEGELVVCNELRDQRTAGASPHLGESDYATAQGRLVLATGAQPGGQYTTTLLDQQRGEQVWREMGAVGNPVLLGPYLFAVEGAADGSRGAQLVRRKIRPRATN